MTKFIVLDIFLFLLFVTLIVLAIWVVIDLFFDKSGEEVKKVEDNQKTDSSK